MAEYQSSFTGAQIDAAVAGAVRFDTAQSKTDAEKSVAQKNMGMGNVVNTLDDLAIQKILEANASSSIFTAYPTQGYINGDTGEFQPLSGYTCYYFEAEKNGELWVDDITGWCQVAIYSETIFDSNDLISLGSNSRETLPKENNKFAFSAGNIIVVCSAGVPFTLHYTDGYVISDEQLDYINAEFEIDKIHDAVFTEITDFDIEHKIYWDNGAYGTNNEIDSTELIPVRQGDKVYVDGEMGSTFHLLLAYNASQTVVSANFQSGTNLEYIVPEGVAYVRCQGRGTAYSAAHIPFKVKVIYNNITHNKADSAKILISKSSAVKFVIAVPSHDGKYKVSHEYEHISKTWDSLSYEDGDGQTQTATNVKSCDYWNCYHDWNAETGVEIAQGHSNFIVQVYGDNSHSGNGHGNEVIQSFYLLADGKIIDIENMSVGDSVLCDTARVIERANVYKVGGDTGGNDYNSNYPALDTSGNPIVRFIHTMDISYQIGNKIYMENSLLVKENGIKFSQCHGAMLESMYSKFDKVMCNNDENTINTITGQNSFTPANGCAVNLATSKSQKCNIVKMWGGDFCIKEEMIQNNPTRFDKSRVYFMNYDNRLKCYFQPVIANFGILSGETMETFNSGDVISVKNVRTIEIK